MQGEQAAARREWRDGWILPLVSAVGLGVGMSHIFTLGLFIAPLQEEFGWSRAAITSGLTMLSATMLLAPAMGLLIDRWGARRIGIAGTLFFCLALAALSTTGPALWNWWALWVLLGLATLTIQSMTWVSAVASRFDRARGLAMSITLCGAGLATATLPPVANRLIAILGWRDAYVALAALMAMLCVPLLLLFFRDARDLRRSSAGAGPSRPARRMTGIGLAEAARSSRFWRLAVVALLAGMSIVALTVHFVPIVTAKGLSRTDAASAAALIGVGSVVGRLATGFLLDRINGSIVGACALSMPFPVLLALIFMDGQAAPLAALLFGLSLGSEVDVLSYLASRHFGMRSFGAVYGTIVAAQGCAVGLGAPIAGFVFDRAQSYEPLLWGMMPVFGLCAILLGSLGAYPSFETEDSAGP